MRWRRVVWRVGCLAVAAGGLFMAVALAPTDPPRRGAVRWVESLSGAERAYFRRDAVMRRLPWEYRRALIDSLPSAVARSEFWQRAFRTYAGQRDLAESQRLAIEQGIRLAVPQNLELGASQDVEMAWRLLKDQFELSFGDAGADALFYASASGETAALPVWERMRYRWRVARFNSGWFAAALSYAVVPVAAFESWCDCYATVPDCEGEERCYPPETSCTKNQLCGDPPLYLQWCDSECRLPGAGG